MKAKDYFGESLGMSRTPVMETRFAKTMKYMMGIKKGKHDLGIITSENPNASKLPAEENKALLRQLKKRLAELKIPFTQQWGKFGYEETSLFLLDVKVETLIDLAKEFKQASFIWGIREEDGTMSFGYCDMADNDVIEVKYGVNTGAETQSRENFVSGFWHKVKEKGSKNAKYFFRKYFIPFFTDDDRKM